MVGYIVVASLFIATHIVHGGFCVWSLFYYFSILCSSDNTIILIGNRELIVILLLSSLYLVTVTDLCLFLTMPWVGLQCIIVVFSDPPHLFCFHNLCSTTYFGYLSKDSNATAHKLSIISYWYA